MPPFDYAAMYTLMSEIVLALVVFLGLLCFWLERDVCLICSCWLLGCCGCCVDFASDEIRFRRWQLLEQKEMALKGRAEEYQA